MLDGRPALWGIVLAGGEGERLKAFVQEHLGTDAPKQFCAFLGQRTMVERTLRRAETLIPRERQVVVAMAHHRRYLFASLGIRPSGTVLFQPEGRDTVPGILLSLVHILHRDPRAIVAIFPSDHFILPGRRFMNAVGKAAEYVRRNHGGAVVVLGVEPTEAETEYGWVEPGEQLAGGGRWVVRRVRQFVEKPASLRARLFMEEGWLWNTMVAVARATDLFALVRQAQPDLAMAFSMIQLAIGTPRELAVLEEVYQMIPSLNFSSSILSRCAESLVVLPVQGVLWSDWGNSDRILATLARLGVSLSSGTPRGIHVRTMANTAATP